MKLANWKRIASIFLLLSVWAFSQQTPNPADALPERIVGAAMTRGGAINFLETLTDTIGGRVTGSPQARAAADMILKTLKGAEFDNAHVEEFAIDSSWHRGPASGAVISPVKQPILVGSYGWAPGTRGREEVALVSAEVSPEGKLSGDLAKLRGAAVLVNLDTGSDLSFASNYVVRRSAVARQLAEAGAAAMLIQSEKPDRMLYTSAAGIYPRGPLPILSVGREDALFLLRLLAKGEVRIALDVQNSFDDHPGKERNIIADLPGTDPSQVVLVGAHYDSWEPAQGANDNGAGVAQVLEVARILKSLGVKPKATIRFAFFSGEEQACLGSRAYVQAHSHELDDLRAALITDDGAQMPLGFLLHGRSDLKSAATEMLANLAPLGAGAVLPGGDLSSDDETFLVAGVPTLSLAVVQGDYDDRHHTLIDTFDRIDPRALALDTAALAVASYSIANAEHPLGRRFTAQEAIDLLKMTHQLEYVELDYGHLGPKSH